MQLGLACLIATAGTVCACMLTFALLIVPLVGHYSVTECFAAGGLGIVFGSVLCVPALIATLLVPDQYRNKIATVSVVLWTLLGNLLCYKLSSTNTFSHNQGRVAMNLFDSE